MRQYIFWTVLIVLFGLGVLANICIGSVWFSPKEIYETLLVKMIHTASNVDPIKQAIIWDIRLPRIVLAVLIGAILSMVGGAMQGVLRNPLADPYIIGTSAGAALGAAIAFALGWGTGLKGVFLLPSCAVSGALFMMGMVFLIARKGGTLSLEIFLLAGVVAGSFVWAAITFILTLLKENVSKILFWLMGSLADKNWWDVWILAPYAAIGVPWLLLHAYPLNLLSIGEEKAGRLGINVERTKNVILILSIFLTAIAVSIAGIIGFIGLLVPHMARLILGPDYRKLFFASFFGGATLLLYSDLIARTIVLPAEIPVGVVTAVLGTPFFCYLLWRFKSVGNVS